MFVNLLNNLFIVVQSHNNNKQVSIVYKNNKITSRNIKIIIKRIIFIQPNFLNNKNPAKNSAKC